MLWKGDAAAVCRRRSDAIGRRAEWRHGDVRRQVRGGRWPWNARVTVTYKHWDGDTAGTHRTHRRRRLGGTAAVSAACRRLLRLVSVILEPDLHLSTTITAEPTARRSSFMNVECLQILRTFTSCISAYAVTDFLNNCISKGLIHIAARYRRNRDQSSRNSGNKCQLPRP